MRAFIAAVAASVAISLGAALILDLTGSTAAERFANDTVRLGHDG
jgi:hypothetical protein